VDGLVAAAEFGRGEIAQARMRPDLIVVSAVALDHDPRLGAIAEPLHVEALIAELAVEAFVVTVLPRLAGVVRQTSASTHRAMAIQRAYAPIGKFIHAQALLGAQ
jgi:hypothetical protein